MTAADMTTTFARIDSTQSADALERELLTLWESERLFEQTLAQNEGGASFVFFEGPPTANGRPGIHHVFARTIKDLFCRYRAMRGYRVSRKAGWDTHGLPVEIEVEKALGINGKQQIESLGVAEFNRRCRESVFRYRADWEQLSWRIGYWLDYANPYVTYSNDYIESVWWALKTLNDRDLLYKGHKILPYCPRCGTALSSHEVALGWRDVEDPSVFVALDVVQDGGTGQERSSPIDADGRPRGRRILVWTTTPWTLVSNVALAVHPDLEYVEVLKRDGKDPRTLILMESRLKAVLGEDFDDRWEIIGRFAGREMVGWRYRRPFDWLEFPEGTEHEVVIGETFVLADDGSGVVHMSPAFGADDYAAGKRHNLGLLQPVDVRGHFPASLPVVGGMFFKAADAPLIEELRARGVLWKMVKITHPYPHCWRCGTPLLYYARSSWFVRTTAYRDAMLARNARIGWHPPETGEKRFNEWLKTNVDWAISRDRYWGTPLPIWVCDVDESHREAVGSYQQLAELAGTTLPDDFDPHKPFIDGYSWACTTAGCTGHMRRVSEVIDAWFDSGSMPFAQWHYPFEHVDTFGAQYPADFIAEGVDQTRGWFYSLLAIGVGLEGALPVAEAGPYRSVVVNAHILDAEGLKMSKSRGNVVDPWDPIGKYGVDAVRLFLVASSDVSIPRRFDERMIRELAGRFLLTLRNVYSGIFAEYANFGWAPSSNDPSPESRAPLDRWMLAELGRLERTVDQALDQYNATAAVRAVIKFVEDDLSNWYVRLSRSRFYAVDTDDSRGAFATLHEVLVSVCRLLAPIAPFLTDWMHRQLMGTSVHLAPFIEPEGGRRGAVDRRLPSDASLDAAMAAVRELSRLGRAAREQVKIKVRQPLSRMVCVAPGTSDEALNALVPLLLAELNVKRIDFATSADALVTLEAKPNFKALGKKFGKKTPLAAAAVGAFTGDELRAFERGAAPLVVSVEGESHEVGADDLTIIRRASGDFAVEEDGGIFAAIDPTVTPELRREGLARELVSRVQRMRKEAGFAISDRITLRVSGSAEVRAFVTAHEEWIAAEVLATELVVVDSPVEETEQVTGTNAPNDMTVVDLDGVEAGVAINRVL